MYWKGIGNKHSALLGGGVYSRFKEKIKNKQSKMN